MLPFLKFLIFVIVAFGVPTTLFALRGFDSPFWWIEIAWLLGVVAWLGVRYRAGIEQVWHASGRPKTIGRWTFRPRSALGDLTAIVVLSALAVAIVPEAAMGQRPVDHDHTVHFFKAWNLWENFLSEGRLRGWSHLWFAGYPAQYLYPIGTDLFVGMVNLASFGWLSLGAAYGVAFFLFYAFKGLAIYALGRVSVGGWAGFLAALFYLGDEGSFRFGGWVYTAVWGVWPQGLSIVFGLFAMAFLPAVLKSRSWLPVVGFGLMLAMAMLTHPVQLIQFTLVGPVVLVAAMTSTDLRGRRLSGAFRMGIGYLCGGLLASIWLIPFFSVSDFAHKYGQGWRSLFETGMDLYALNWIEGTWIFPTALAIVGTAFLLFSRKTMQAFIGLMIILLLGASATDLLADFNFIELSDSFKFVQWQRLSMLFKPFLFIAAGAAIVEAASMVRSRESWTGEAVASRVVIVSILVLPVVYGFVNEVRQNQFVRNLTEVEDRPRREAIDKVVKWANEEWARREVKFYRLGAYVSHDDHTFVDLGTRIPMPMYKSGFMPAAIFKYKPKSKSVATFEEMNVRYVLSPKKLPAKSYELVEDLGQSTYLYELRTWKKDPFVVTGEGEVELVSWEDEEIVLKAGEGASGRLRLNVSYFDRWNAYRDGQEVPIKEVGSKADPNIGFMSVELAPGTYRFVFEREAPEVWASVTFALGILLVLLLFLLEIGKPRVFERFDALANDLIDWIEIFEDWQEPMLAKLAFAGLVGVVLAAAGLAYWTPPLEGESEIRYDFLDHVSDARVYKGNRTRSCRHVLGRHLCGDDEWEQVFSTFRDVGGDWKTCIWAHPLRGNQPLKIQWDDVPRGSQIAGWYGIAASGHTSQNWPVQISVAVDGVELDTLETKDDSKRYDFSLDVPEGAEEMDVSFEIQARNNGRRHLCFRAAVTE